MDNNNNRLETSRIYLYIEQTTLLHFPMGNL